MAGQVTLAGFDLSSQSSHESILETSWEIAPAMQPTEGELAAVASSVDKIKIAALWCRPQGLPRMWLATIPRTGQYSYFSCFERSVEIQPLLQEFESILNRADQESWKMYAEGSEEKRRFDLVNYLIPLISRVFPVPLDSQYEAAAAQKRANGGDPEALKTLIYFLENKIEIKNSFGAVSTIVQLDHNFRTITQAISDLDRDLKVFTISGSAFTATMFGTTVSIKPNTLEALLKKLLIAAHDLNEYRLNPTMARVDTSLRSGRSLA